MDKKLYIQPQTEIQLVAFTNMLLDGSVTGEGGATIGWGGDDEDPEAGADVKSESWTNIWE